MAGESGLGSSVGVNGIYLQRCVRVSVRVAAFPQFAAVLDGSIICVMSVRRSQAPLGLDFFV